MYSIENFLSTYPTVLVSSDLAQALGCSAGTARRLLRSEVITASKENGQWLISAVDLAHQLNALRNTPMNE